MVPGVVESIVFLLCLEDVAIISAAISSSEYQSTNLPSHSPNFKENSSVCWTDNIAYNDRDVIPAARPCEQCICNPPDIICSAIECEIKSGCNIIQKSNQCCPDYKCDCEYNGQTFNNGEKMDTSDMPCRVCYCRGGDVICTTIECYVRNDCEGKIVPGICCPKYDHCPPSATNTSTVFVTSAITSKTGKLSSQPWIIITDSARTLDPGESTTSSDEELDVITDITSQPENIITAPQEQVSSKDDMKLYTRSGIPGDSLTGFKNLTEISDKSEMARGVKNSTEGVIKNLNDETRIPDDVIIMWITTTLSSNKMERPSETKSDDDLTEGNEYRIPTSVNVTDNATENQEALVTVVEKGSNLRAILAGNVTKKHISSLINSADTTESSTDSIRSTESAILVPVQNTSNTEATEISNLNDSRTVEEIITTYGHIDHSITTEILDVIEYNDEGDTANLSSTTEAELNSAKVHSSSTIELVTSTQGGYPDTSQYHELSNMTAIITEHEMHQAQILVNSSTSYRNINTIDKFGTVSMQSNIDFAPTTTYPTTNHNTDISSAANNAASDSTFAPSTPSGLDYTPSSAHIDITSSLFNTTPILGVSNNTNRTSPTTHFYIYTNGSADPLNLTATFGNDSINVNYTDSYAQKSWAHPVKLISSVNSIYLSAGLGYRESSSNETVFKEAPDTNTPSFKILLGGLRPLTRPPNSTMGPLFWLKGSLPVNMTTTHSSILHNVSTATNESLKNESRQESGPEAKIYNPLMPYPEEYPEEYQTIQNGPAIIITRTTYTRIPDVTWTTVTMATLPTYERLQKAEDAFAGTLFDRKFGDQFHASEKTSDEVTAGGYYANIDVKKPIVKVKSLDDKPSSVKKSSLRSTVEGAHSLKWDENMEQPIPVLDEKDVKLVRNFMKKFL